MFRLRRLAFCVSLFFFFALILPTLSHASDYFSTAYNVTYLVQEDGTTHATMKVTLTNKTKDYFASSYKIQVGFENIDNLTATDGDGSLSPKKTAVEGGTEIEASFNKHVVGEGNTLTYTIAFDTPDIALKDGSIWEINIPGLANSDDFSDFTAEVKVPPSFGTPSYIKPDQGSNSTIFSKDQLGKSGISIAYGTTQHYAFNLFYHLKNSNLFPIKTDIALPPSTNYQDVYIEYMNPKPLNVTLDRDGNWLATYRLAPSQRVNVQVRGTAVVSLSPKKSVLSEEDRKAYLKAAPYWEVENPELIAVAKNFKTPRDIYDYLVKNLTYDFSRVEENRPRLGALGTLHDKASAVCLEFTDLFIALARVSGIPAREVDGYANTENSTQRPLSLVKDILHAWPEYYDDEKQEWVMVDPTWGNTTGGVDYFDVLDFDHVAFVIRGYDSEYPVPAGGYKYDEDENLKDVNVTFPRRFTPPSEGITVDSNEKESHYSLLPITTMMTIRNAGAGLVTPQKVIVNGQDLMPGSQGIDAPAIPPYGYVSLPVSFKSLPLLTNRTFPLTITIAGITLASSLHVTPVVFSAYAVAGGSFFALLTIIIFIIAKKTRRISLPK